MNYDGKKHTCVHSQLLLRRRRQRMRVYRPNSLCDFPIDDCFSQAAAVVVLWCSLGGSNEFDDGLVDK
jgi:hypothetical protein